VSNFWQRTATAIIFVVIMVGSVLLGQMVFAFLLLIITFLGLQEFYRLVSGEAVQPFVQPSVWAGCTVYAMLALNALELLAIEWFLALIPLLFMLFIAELWRVKVNPLMNIAISLTGIFYIAVPFGLMIYFFNPSVGSGLAHYGLVLGYLFILWLNDTGAYLIGSFLGKRKLFERISPKKTWEGSIGGAILAMLTGWIFSLLKTGFNLEQWLIIAAIVVVTGTLGDLVESMFKRSQNIKDSGNIMPGHGGILDRFDAVLLSVPFVFLYLAFFLQ
jgi:phosphatidate cytidylyltransferase